MWQMLSCFQSNGILHTAHTVSSPIGLLLGNSNTYHIITSCVVRGTLNVQPPSRQNALSQHVGSLCRPGFLCTYRSRCSSSLFDDAALLSPRTPRTFVSSHSSPPPLRSGRQAAAGRAPTEKRALSRATCRPRPLRRRAE